MAGVMSDKQTEEVTKVVYAKSVTDVSLSPAGKSSGKLEKANDYEIEKQDKDGSSVKKTKADITMRDTISRVIRKIQNVFGDRMQVKKVTEVDLTQIGLYDDRSYFV